MEDMRKQLLTLVGKIDEEEVRCVYLLLTNLLKKYPDD